MIAAVPGRVRRPRVAAGLAAYNENGFHPVTALRLSELPRRTGATVDRVEDRQPGDAIARRLRELGFVAGECVEIVAAGPFGGEPLLVRVGFTRFALRRAEAARVLLRAGADGAPA